MSWYTKSLNSLITLSWKSVSKNPPFPFRDSLTSRMPVGLNRNCWVQHNLTATRYYCNDSGEGTQLPDREWWYKNPTYRRAITAIVRSGVLISILETVPYTNRTHLTLVPKYLERGHGRISSYLTKLEFRRRILPPADPKSIRVHSIMENIVGALQLVWSDMEGLKWEVLVVNKPVVNSFVEPAGTIVVYTGLLDRLKSDAEIASIIGHEVGHVVGRHAAEKLSKWFLLCILSFYIHWGIAVISFIPLLKSNSKELEADHIGLLLMASAGYDPRVAPKVLRKLGGETDSGGFLSTYPSPGRRAKLLSEAKIMDEALLLYKASRGIEASL